MLKLTLSLGEDIDPVELTFEHSLVSLSKWEAIHEKPFFSTEAKTQVESRSYLEEMLLSENAPAFWSEHVTDAQMAQTQAYINTQQSATTFTEDPNAPKSREVITSELIYYWMVAFRIPFYPCETWHLNRLMTLIRINGIKQTKPKPMSKQAQAEHYRKLNAERRQKLGTAG